MRSGRAAASLLLLLHLCAVALTPGAGSVSCDLSQCAGAASAEDCFPLDATRDARGCCWVCPLTLGARCEPEGGGELRCAEGLRCHRAAPRTDGDARLLAAAGLPRTPLLGRCVWDDPAAQTEPLE